MGNSDREQRDNSGVLFRNDKKKDGDKLPLYTGPCMVNGRPMRMAAWLKDGRDGVKFMSIQFTEPQESSGGGSRGGHQYNDEPF